MFHLLVSYDGWGDRSDTIPTERIYIKSSREKDRLFRNADGTLNIEAIRSIPAVLMSETGGGGPQFARVAFITLVREGPRTTSIQYSVDEGIPLIPNGDIERMAVNGSALNHTHWEVCDADIYREILLGKAQKKTSPSVFNIDALSDQRSDLISVMMPFSKEFDAVYGALCGAVGVVGFTAARADNFWEHEFVIQDIVTLIAKSRVVICDCSGRNPNVFYEAGIAHSLGKDVILITQSNDDIPFDLRHIRYIRYKNDVNELKLLTEGVAQRIRTIVGI